MLIEKINYDYFFAEVGRHGSSVNVNYFDFHVFDKLHIPREICLWIGSFSSVRKMIEN